MDKYYVMRDGKYLKKETGYSSHTGISNHTSWVTDKTEATVFYFLPNAKAWAKKVKGNVVTAER